MFWLTADSLISPHTLNILTRKGYITGPYTLCALNMMVSLPALTEVGTAMANWAEGPETHQASATDMMSPHGLRGSPYLPRPECSREEKENTTSNTSSVLFLY